MANKIKVQFMLDESISNLLEVIRKRFFNSTSKQFFYEKILTEWATIQSRRMQ